MQALDVRSTRPLTESYWAFLQVRGEYSKQPQYAVAWWMAGANEPGLNPTERLIFDHIASAERVLDIGAGDLRVKHRLLRAGFRGRYESTDVSAEANHDYAAVADAPSITFDAVLLLEVVEHVTLDDFDRFMDEVLRVLRPGGKLVVSTPNADFIQSIWSADMTHRHPYRAVDLAAYLHLRGVSSTIHRVAWQSPRDSLRERLRQQAARLLTRGILQVDYARGVLLLGVREF